MTVSLRQGLWVLLALALLLLLITTTMAQQRPPCWYVPNGVNTTTQCANGYWQTITPEGEVYSGNGMPDPSASAQGSTIVINPATGGPSVGAGPTVTPPTQQLPMLAPYEAQTYGFQPRQD
jgi:hypothetical protein